MSCTNNNLRSIMDFIDQQILDGSQAIHIPPSPGGDMQEAMEIATALKDLPAGTTVVLDDTPTFGIMNAPENLKTLMSDWDQILAGGPGPIQQLQTLQSLKPQKNHEDLDLIQWLRNQTGKSYRYSRRQKKAIAKRKAAAAGPAPKLKKVKLPFQPIRPRRKASRWYAPGTCASAPTVNYEDLTRFDKEFNKSANGK